jgi:phospholipase/carboxylesterase
MSATFDGIERQTGESPVATLLWLHGLGADASDFVPILPEVVRRQWPSLRFVFPNAPVRPITINNGMRMRAWFDLLGLDFNSRMEDEAGTRASVAILDGLIEREVARGIPLERIFVAGFSQGGAIAAATLLGRRAPLAGAILLSTWVPPSATRATDAGSGSTATPVFMAHGAQDPIVPQAYGLRSAEFLRERGYPVEWRSYPMPHSVSPQELIDLGAWLDQRLASWS